MKKIFLVRHGESEFNAKMHTNNHVWDSSLTELGNLKLSNLPRD